jgi:FlaA1/EpsC-like NDP-sugar epimerase
MYSGRRVLLIGYGVLGTELLLDLERAGAVVVVILDDRFADLAHEQRVQGPLDLAPEILDTDDVDLVVIGASLIGSGRINWLTGHARRRGIPIYVAPERSEIDSMDRLHEQARVPSIEDLFARSSLEVDWDRITRVVAGRRVLVTGAGGSIGRQTVIQLASHGVEVIGLLDRDDCLLHDVAVELTGSMHDPLHPLFHVDIQHESKVLRAFRDFRPEIVIHAAALKHVTTLEMDPSNALAVNVLGTANVLEAAAATGVDLLVNVSTDKAASRIGSLGVSKYIGERMTSAMGVPGYRSVRFGNVIGSRGSVLHTFRLQAEHHGEVAVRGDETTRFFMTPGEAGSLVLSTFAQKSASGTFVFRMGDPVQIRRLAQAVIDDVDVGARIKMTSLEAGEARHEQLFGDDEKPIETDVEEVFRVDPPGLDTSEVRGRLGSLDEVMSLTVEAGRALLEELAEC